MSKSGSRYGRRSNWFKIHCLLQEQGSSMNAQNGLNATNFLTPNGASIYPGLFNTRHMLNTDKFLEARLNGFSPFSDSKHFLNDLEKYKTSSEDSGGSSAGDMDDESRSTSVTSRGPAHLHQTPSPLSEKASDDYNQNNNNNNNNNNNSSSSNNNHRHHHHHHHHHNQSTKKLSITLPSSPSSALAQSPPFTSPQSHSVYASPYVSPTSLRPLPHHIAFPVTRPGLTPAAAANNLIFLDTLGNPSAWSVRSGGDLLLCSPAAGGVAVEQDQPIDLSVKAATQPGDSLKDRPNSARSSRSPSSPAVDSGAEDDEDDDDDDQHRRNDLKTVHIPLDLTSKRHQHELTTHSS